MREEKLPRENVKFLNEGMLKKKFSPITGMPQGPGGNLQKECCHMAFPVRNAHTRKQRNKICPADRRSSNEKAMLIMSKNCTRRFLFSAATR